MRLNMLFAATALFLMAHAYVMDHDDFDFEIMHDDEYDITKMEVTFKDEPRWGFEDINATEDIRWYPCYKDRLSCAKLSVPLDYEDLSAGYIDTAWIKYTPSNNSAEDLLVNPGGPGGSGIDYVLGQGVHLSSKFGKQYNIVGFDPRGVGFSGPKVSCRPGRISFAQANSLAFLNGPLQEVYQRAYAYGQHCTHVNAHSRAKYAGTVATAQDMMHFVSLRYAQKNQHQKGSIPKLTRGTDKTAINADGSEEGKLWFYGASYGTLLGQTLAVLFPNQIGRMILDGNVDGVQHYSGVPSDEVDAGDAVFHDFFTSCYEAGPRLCAYHGGATSVDDIENRYLDMLQNLRQMPALSNDNGKTNVITDLDVSMSMIKAMYSPLRAWPALALFLEDLESGSFVSAYHESMKIRSYYELTKGSQFSEANRFIRCLDADKNFAIESYDDYLDAIEVFRKESYFEGPLVSLVTLRDCIGMDITPPPSQQFPGFNKSGTNASFPILFVNPVRDPVTPISSARKMSALFPGSVVVALNSTGHGTWSAKSECMDQVMREYMQNGILPPRNLMCEAESRPFFDVYD